MYGSGMHNTTGSSPLVTNCTFLSNYSHGGGGMYNESSSPVVRDCVFSDNIVIVHGGGGMYNIVGSSPVVQRCTFSNNRTGVGTCGGAGMCNDSSAPVVSDCVFVNNTATYGSGGGMHNSSASPLVTNCTFVDNTGAGVSAMDNLTGSSPALVNCTFSNNRSSGGGGVICNRDSSGSPVLSNCIVWGNQAAVIEGSATVTHSCVEGGFEGEGNIDEDPMLVGAGFNDLRLHSSSPCIDAGTAAGAPAADMKGVARPQGTGIDMGAHEFETGTVLATFTVPLSGDPLLDSAARWRINGGNWRAMGETAGLYAGTYSITFGNAAHYTTPAEEIVVLAPGEHGEPLNPYVSSPGAHLWMVDKDNTSGVEDGTSWTTAFSTIQAAVDAANADGGGEIWVAEGTYSGATIELKEGAHIYGGFSGTETTRTDRDWAAYPTTIDGEDSRGCVTSSDIPAGGATLDGFTLQNGWQGKAGGISNDWSFPTIRSCAFVNNKPSGMYNSSSSPVVEDCAFLRNDTAGMHNDKGSWPEVTGCTFSQSTRYGMYNEEGSSPRVTNCTFSNNDFAGMYNNEGSSPGVTNCVFSSNTSRGNGGGMTNTSSSPVVTNCTFAGNRAASGYGGALNNDADSTPALTNCILWGNLPSAIGGWAVVSHSCVEGGFRGEGNINADPGFIGADFADFRLHPASPCIGAGTLAGAPPADLNGVARPQGDGVDMGAHEYEPGTVFATLTVSPTGDALLDGSPRWRINGGNWRPLGGIVDLYAGTYVITFSNAAHYTTPAAVTVVLAPGEDRVLQPAYASSPGAHLWRVDVDNTSGVEDGASWATAFGTIQAGVDAANADGGGEVWVAEGAYTGAGRAILLKDGAHVYGGFSSIESARTERDWSAHPTIIDGENARHCVITRDIPVGGATFDGFTVQNGAASGGAGMSNWVSSLTLANCAFVANWGGAVSNADGSSPVVMNCTFSNNDSWDSAGAILNHPGSSPVVINCTFSNNESWGAAGAMLNHPGSSPTLVNCILWGSTPSSITGPGLAKITYSCVEGGFEGEGNIAADPQFVNADNNDLRLQPASPCIDAGTSAGAPDADIDGVNRPQNLAVDMGAHEFLSTAPLGSVEVVILPQIAADAGALWSPGAGHWLSSGASIDLFEGVYTITFSEVLGRLTPQPVEVTVSGTQQVVVTETYGIDVNNDGAMNILDVQLVINAALGLPGAANGDINGDGATNALDIQLVINAVLGLV